MDFTVEDGAIRFGLSAIKGVGEGAIQAILDARERVGRFESMHALSAEVDSRQANKRVLEALVFSGALDSLGYGRSSLAAGVDGALEYGHKQRADREAGQGNLFGGGDGEQESPRAELLSETPEWDERTRLAHEKDTLGFYISGHPLEAHAGLIRDFASHTTDKLAKTPGGSEVAVCGLVTNLNRRKSRKGDWFATLQLEDSQGRVETVIFPKTYKTSGGILEDDKPFLITGRLQVEEEQYKILADDICPLEELRDRKADAVQVQINSVQLDETLVENLRKTVSRHSGDARLYLEVCNPGRYRFVAQVESALRVRPCQELSDDLDRLLGPGRVRYRAQPNRYER